MNEEKKKQYFVIKIKIASAHERGNEQRHK